MEVPRSLHHFKRSSYQVFKKHALDISPLPGWLDQLTHINTRAKFVFQFSDIPRYVHKSIDSSF